MHPFGVTQAVQAEKEAGELALHDWPWQTVNSSPEAFSPTPFAVRGKNASQVFKCKCNEPASP